MKRKAVNGRKRYLALINWDNADARARYMRAVRVLRGDKKHLSAVEKEFRDVVLRVHVLIEEI